MTLPDLNAEQLRAVELATELCPSTVVIDGGPCTGKTTALRAILDELDDRGLTTCVLAPSARRAHELEARLERPVQTVSEALGHWAGIVNTGGVRLADVVVLDRACRIGAPVLASLVEACVLARTLILIGDSELPPPRRGSPYVDLVRSDAVRSVRLTEVHSDHPVLEAAHGVAIGIKPTWSIAPASMGAVQLVPCVHERAVAPTVGAVVRTLEQDGLIDWTVISPLRNRAAGTSALNVALEDRRAPSRSLLRGRFRAGTRVQQTRDEPRLSVARGEIGQVVSSRRGDTPLDDEVWVRFARSEVPYRGAQLSGLRPAWALTCEQALGQTWDAVVLVAHGSVGLGLTRDQVYAAFASARKRVVVVGQEAVLTRALERSRPRRETLLRHWLAGEVNA